MFHQKKGQTGKGLHNTIIFQQLRPTLHQKADGSLRGASSLPHDPFSLLGRQLPMNPAQRITGPVGTNVKGIRGIVPRRRGQRQLRKIREKTVFGDSGRSGSAGRKNKHRRGFLHTDRKGKQPQKVKPSCPADSTGQLSAARGPAGLLHHSFARKKGE